MAYIKTQAITSIAVYMMEMHQTGQENYLTEVMVETNGLEVSHLSRSPAAGRRGCFKCAVTLAAVMGLATAALVIGFVLHFFILTPSCKQDAPPPSDGAKVTKACPLTKSDEHGIYNIFTVEKAATYLIYGWMKFPDIPGKDIALRQTWKGTHRDVKIQKANKAEIFFFDKIKLVKDSRLSVYSCSAFTDSLFHVYEL